MAASSADSNPWRNDASFDLAFGGLCRFVHEVSAQQPLSSHNQIGQVGEDSFKDPFILRLQLADQVVASRRADRRAALLRRLRSETSGVFAGRRDEILAVCSSLRQDLIDFEKFDEACDIQREPDALHQRLAIAPDYQKKIVDTLDLSLLLAQSRGSIDDLQAVALNAIERLLSNVSGRVDSLQAVSKELADIDGLIRAFDTHVKRNTRSSFSSRSHC